VKDAHVGSIPWEEDERNEVQLAVNSQAYAPKRFSPPREGPALLQGLLLWGRCGERMTVRYHQRAGSRIVPDYLCAHKSIERGEPPCQRLPGSDLDRAIGALLLECVTPEALALTLAVQNEVVHRADEAQRLRHLQYVLVWEISIPLDTSFCLEALDRALCVATPEIFNNDQGVQFTSNEFTSQLKAAHIRISWDGRGWALDNIFVERLWRSVKYEEVYIKDYQSVPDAVRNLRDYFTFYNHERLHQSLDYQTPAQVYLKR
jgi:integrase-like protein